MLIFSRQNRFKCCNDLVYIFLDNGVMTTPKRRILSFVFTVLCFKKPLLIRIWNKWERVNFFKDQKNTLDKNWLLKASDHTLTTEVRRRHWPRSSETWKRLQKYLAIFGYLRRLSQVFGNLRKCLGDLRKFSEVIGDLRKFSEIFVWSSVISRRFRTIFRNLRKVSHDLRRSSKYISWPSAVFECVRFNFGNLRCNLHSCYTFQHYVNKKCTPF